MFERATLGTRTFQKKFNMDYFLKNVAKPIRDLLQAEGSEEVIDKIVAAINAGGSPLSENIDSNGETPSSSAFKEMFPGEIEEGKLEILLCKEWGPNAGSPEALNNILKIVKTKFVLFWSLELEMNLQRIKRGLRFMEEKDLFVAGFLRRGYQEYPAQNTPQNTGAFWRVKYLRDIGGFSERCSGADGKMVLTEEFGEVPCAGMENTYAMKEYYKKHKKFFDRHPNNPFWAMIPEEEKNLPEWNTSFPDDQERVLMVKKMRERQNAVDARWGEIVLPDMSQEEIVRVFDAHRYQE